MTKQPSPRLDALRAMREREFDQAQTRGAKDALRRKLEQDVKAAAARADNAAHARKVKKAKKAKRNSRRGNPA